MSTCFLNIKNNFFNFSNNFVNNSGPRLVCLQNPDEQILFVSILNILINLFDSCSKPGLVRMTVWPIQIPESLTGSVGSAFSHLVIYLRAPHRERYYDAELTWQNDRESSGEGGECLRK